MNGYKICGICRRALCRITVQGVSRYEHVKSGTYNHLPDPIDMPPDYLDEYGECDFCCWERPTFIVPVKDFLVPVPFTPDTRTTVMRGDWAACPWCAGLIDTDCWSDLIARNIAMKRCEGTAMPPGYADLITATYEGLRANRNGDVRPMRERNAGA